MASAASSSLPIVLFIDTALPIGQFSSSLSGELACREEVGAGDSGLVVALVTGIEPIGTPEIEPYPSLRMVLTCSTGVDHLDLDVLRARGLTVCRTPTYCSDEVADHALACVLAGWRGLWTLGAEVRRGRWPSAAMLRRFDRQRLGIIGLGRIGSRLARRAQALGIEVVGIDSDVGISAPDGVTILDLEELLPTSDAVSLHTPGTPGAPPLLDAERIARMKTGAVLVNLSRASLVDLDAVVAALRERRLTAAFDVWPQEPPAPDDERLLTPGLLLTPHVGWSSPQAEEAGVAEAVAALRSVLVTGSEPAGVVV
jgi:D-3-phosphoglycerate dehydrogenase